MKGHLNWVRESTDPHLDFGHFRSGSGTPLDCTAHICPVKIFLVDESFLADKINPYQPPVLSGAWSLMVRPVVTVLLILFLNISHL